MALVRMVNELLDSIQAGKTAAPLHSLAKQLDLPNSFVELRHAATHEDIPSIYLLRSMCHRGLEWLWKNYWSLQESTADTPNQSPESAKELMRQWRRLRRSRLSSPLGKEEWALVQRLDTSFKSDPSEFLRVLFDKNVLIPSTTGSGDEFVRKVQLSIMMWAPALLAMDTSFNQSFVLELSKALNQQEWPGISNQNTKYTAYELWLLHFIEHASGLNKPSIVGAISEQARPWNAKALAIFYRLYGDEKTARLAQKMADFTGVDLDLSTSNAPAIPEKKSKWNKVENWTTRPLGCYNAVN